MRASAAAVALTCLVAAPGRADPVRDFAADETGAAACALSLARRAFDAYTLRRERIPTPDDVPELLRSRSGVFVSAAQGNAPRCCMGSLYPTQPTLADEIIQAAVAAAGLDARKPPVEPRELPDLQLIVSVVAPPESITDPHLIDPVPQGLAIRGRERWGVVLPGETRRLDRAIEWATIRAGVAPGEPLEYFRLRAFRMAETKREPAGAHGRCGR